MVPFTGRCPIKQFVRGKPNPEGMKNFVLADKNGLVYDFLIYQGKNRTISTTFRNFHIGESVILELCESVPTKSTIYCDRFFTTERLLNTLRARNKIYLTGPLAKNRLPSNCNLLPEKEMKKKERGYSTQIVREDKKACLVQWNDNKPVTMLSSQNSKYPLLSCSRWSKSERRRIDIGCPAVIKNYNEQMGGVDLIDRYLALYRITTKCNKWTVRAILHFLDFAACNGWVMNRHNMGVLNAPTKISLFDFKLELAQQLLEEESSDEEEDSDVDDGRARPFDLPSVQFRRRKADHMPEVIESNNPKRCRFEGCNKKSKIICEKCNVILCLNKNNNCYKKFHEPPNQ